MSNQFLIANMEVGLERDREPWLLPDEAFPNLEDCYLFRGRITRRLGYYNLGRLGTKIGAAVGAAFAGSVIPPFSNPITPGTVEIEVGATVFYDDLVTGTLIGVPSGTGTINYATGAITLTFGAPILLTDVFVRNRLPVMGLRTRELTTINEEQLIGFDTIKANRFSNALNRFVDISFHKTTNNAFSWTGSNSDFFWTNNYAGAFWATNNVAGFQSTVDSTTLGQGDGIRWYDGSGWINFLPQVDNSGNFLMGALLIFNYRNRLVMLNTVEGTAIGASNRFPQRARWSQNGTPYYVIPVPSSYTGGVHLDAWNSDEVGRGGFVDAPTSEQIISAQFIHDTLIVFFERSTWELRYVGDPALPFVWYRVNVELGAESTFASVAFDKGLLGVGNYGIITANNSEVQRIDQKIPDEVFEIHNGNEGVKRVYGIRDFTKQLVYWTFPNADTNPTFPNRILVYDYLLGTYAFFNDSLTCFGTLQPFADRTWAELQVPWKQVETAWNSGQFQSNYPLIVAGNQQGFVFQDINRGRVINDPSLFITSITAANPAVITSANHNLSVGTIIKITDIEGMTLAIAALGVGTALAGSTSYTFTLLNLPAQPGTVTVTIGALVFNDDGNGAFPEENGGTINYSTGEITVSYDALGADTAVTVDYTKAISDGIFRVGTVSPNTFQIQNIDANGNYINVDSSDLSAYQYNGRIGVRNNFKVLTKKFNPFLGNALQTRLRDIDYFLEFSPGVEFTTDVYIDDQNSAVDQTIVAMPETDRLSKIWYKANYTSIGQFMQLELTFNPFQIFDPNKSNGFIAFHGFMMHMDPAGRLTYGTIK